MGSYRDKIKTTFGTVSDDFIDGRFDPKFKKEFLEKLEVFDDEAGDREFPIQVHFFGEFENNTKRAINILVNEVFNNAKRYQLVLKREIPEVQFYTPLSWVEENPDYLSQKLVLPASKITFETGFPRVNLIVPEKTESAETVIKTVRLLCSKLFGKLFFEENIPTRPQYKLAMESLETATFDLDEITRFSRLLDRFSDPLMDRFDQTASALSVRTAKAREVGKKEFLKKIIQNKEKVNEQDQKLIRDNFSDQLEWLKKDPREFYQVLTERITEHLAQVTVVLPHELLNFQFLKEKGDWTYYHALEERLLMVVNYLEEIIQCREFMLPVNQETTLDYPVSDLWIKTLTERSNRIRKKGFVKLYLFEGARLTKNQESQKKQFPLWIWEKGILKNYPKVKNNQKMVEKIQGQYTNNVYQKLFETSQWLIQGLKSMQDNYKYSYEKLPEYTKLKSLFTWVDFRKEIFLDLLHTVQVGKRLLGLYDMKNQDQKKAVKNFETGWSYFVSFALIHQYYLDLSKKKDSAAKKEKQFLELIEKYIKDRIESDPSFCLADLFFKVYRKNDYDLEQITTLMTQDSKTLDFFIFNQPEIFKKNTPREPIIERYADSLIRWLSENGKNRVQEDELKGFIKKRKSQI
ncbi:MAG: hypothetical protein OEY59_08900 [Deltaproteobacteria bacterium]|nr:hypothetical protein [Deltaproteobacteria bacterium]